MKTTDMVSGKWYKVEIYGEIWIIKFHSIDGKTILTDRSGIGTSRYDEHKSRWGTAADVKSIEPATREEILNYYPNENFELTDSYLIY